MRIGLRIAIRGVRGRRHVRSSIAEAAAPMPPGAPSSPHPGYRPPPAVRRRAAFYSITSSARSRIDGGMARPSAVAVLRFTTISNFVGSSTGSLRREKPGDGGGPKQRTGGLYAI